MATTLTTENLFNGNGSNTDFVITFPYLKEADVKVEHPIGTVLSSGYSFLNATTIRITTAPASGTNNVKIYRDTNVDAAKAIFATGSSIRATDLNNNAEQSLFAGQEKVYTNRITNDAITTDKIFDDAVTSAKIADNAVGVDQIANNSINSAMIIDGTIVNADIGGSAAIAGTKISPDFGSQNIATTGTVDGRDVSADGTKLDGIETNATADQTNAEIRAAVEAASDSNVFTDADHSKLNAIEAGATADQTNAEIRAAVEAATDSNVFTDADHSKLNAIEASATADQTASEIRALVESASDSNVFTDADHSKLNAIEASATADQTAAEIRTLVESASDSNVFTDADHTKLNAIEASATADQTAAEIKTAYESNADTNVLTDAEKAVIDGVTANTSELNILDGLTSNTTELNMLDGKQINNSINSGASHGGLPTSLAVNNRIIELVTDVGGFVPIATEVAFPTSNPDINNGAGTIVSIADAGGLKVADGSGSGTYAGTAGHSIGATTTGSTAVTITGIDSSLHGTTLAAGQGMLVETTTTLNTYTYHRLVLDEAGVQNAKTAVDDFNERYRVGSSNPTSSLDDGDLFFNTTTDKMLVYNATGSSWDEVQSVGNFFINTISSYSGTGGNSATFNGSAYRFVLSNAGTYAQQHIVSVNGVIQKPNSGTSQPAEGFAIDGSSILFSSAPASGSDYFIITVGASVNIGAPSNNTVTSAMIVDGTITGGDIAADTISEDKLDIHAAPSGTDKFLAFTSNGMEWAVPSNTNTQLTEEQVEDFVGGMVTGNTETGITVTYEDSDGTLDFVVAPEGDTIKSTTNSNEANTKFLRADGDGTCSWQIPPDTNTQVGGSTGVDFNDSIKARFGTGNDLAIYHNGTDAIIDAEESGATRTLLLKGGTTTDRWIELQSSDAEPHVRCAANSYVRLYYDNSLKFETTANGVKVSDGHLYVNRDDAKIILGASSDFEIYHTASSGTIFHDNGPGGLKLRTDDLYIYNAAGDETMIHAVQDGAVKLYHDNNKKFETTSTGVTVTGGIWSSSNNSTNIGSDGTRFSNLYMASAVNLQDGAQLQLGNDNDSYIYKETSNNNTYWRNTSGNTDIDTTSGEILLTSGNTAEAMLKAITNGTVELYYDNSKKFETTSAGVTITGDLTVTGSAPGGGVTSDAQGNTVAGSNAGDSFTGTDALNNTLIGKNAGTNLSTADENVAVGRDCMGSGTVTGNANTAVGDNAMYDLTSGTDNVGVGRIALANITTGSGNAALGKGALHDNQTGSYNVAIGHEALYSHTGGNNIGIGYRALRSQTGVNHSIGIGYDAGVNNTSDNNVFIGSYAGDANTSGSSNTAIGKDALSACTTNGTNTAVGASAAQNITGPGNTCVGASTFNTSNTGSNNVMMGYLTGQYKTGASNSNVAVGAYSFRGGDEGTQNTCVGTSSGSVISTGDDNVCVGQAAGSYITTGSNNIFIGAGTGMLGSPTGVYNTDSNTLSLGNNAIDDFYCADTSISSSDKRDKTDIAEWTHGLDWINKLKPVTYRWDKRAYYSADYSITPDGTKKRPRQHLGFLAQDVLEVEQSFGYADQKADMLTVNLNCDDTSYGLKYERLVVVLTKAVQELSAKNDALEARIATLEAA